MNSDEEAKQVKDVPMQNELSQLWYGGSELSPIGEIPQLSLETNTNYSDHATSDLMTQNMFQTGGCGNVNWTNNFPPGYCNWMRYGVPSEPILENIDIFEDVYATNYSPYSMTSSHDANSFLVENCTRLQQQPCGNKKRKRSASSAVVQEMSQLDSTSTSARDTVLKLNATKAAVVELIDAFNESNYSKINQVLELAFSLDCALHIVSGRPELINFSLDKTIPRDKIYLFLVALSESIPDTIFELIETRFKKDSPREFIVAFTISGTVFTNKSRNCRDLLAADMTNIEEILDREPLFVEFKQVTGTMTFIMNDDWKVCLFRIEYCPNNVSPVPDEFIADLSDSIYMSMMKRQATALNSNIAAAAAAAGGTGIGTGVGASCSNASVSDSNLV